MFHPIERLSRITWQFYDYPFFFSRLFISKLLQICSAFPQKCFQPCCRIRKENSVPRQLVCTHHQVADITACRFFCKGFLPKGRHHAAHRFIHVCIVAASMFFTTRVTSVTPRWSVSENFRDCFWSSISRSIVARLRLPFASSSSVRLSYIHESRSTTLSG